MKIAPLLVLALFAVPVSAAYSPLERAKAVTRNAVSAAPERLNSLTAMPLEFAGATLMMNYAGGTVEAPKDKAALIAHIEAERKRWIETRDVMVKESERNSGLTAAGFGAVERMIEAARSSGQMSVLIVAAGFIVEDLDADLALAMAMPETGPVPASQALIGRKIAVARNLRGLGF